MTEHADESEHDVAEVARLKAERDALAHEVERLEQRPAKRRKMRAVVAVLLVVVSVLSLAAALPGLWVRRSLADEGRYLSIVGPLPQNPAVAQALSRELTHQVFEALHVQERLTTALRSKLPEVAFLAGPITESIESFTRDQVQKVIQSDAFDELWIEANSVLQENLMGVIRGESENVSITGDGEVVLNLLPTANAVLARLSGVASDLAGRPITLPTITEDTLSSEAIAKLEAALGVDLPDDFAQIVVFQSDELAEIQTMVSSFERALIVVVVVFVLAVAGAIWISPRRRRTVLQLSVAGMVVVVIERRLAFQFQERVIESARAENRSAVRVITDSLLDGLLWSTGWVLAILAVTALVSLLTGPYPWAVSLRSGVARGGRAGYGALTSPETVRWAGIHRDTLMVGGAVVGVLVLLFAGLGFWGLVIWIALIALFEVGVYTSGLRVRSGAV